MDTTVVKGLRVLEELVQSPESLGVAELANKCGWSRSNVHRLLQTLCALGYAESKDGRYRATLKVWSLGSQVISRVDVKALAMPVLQRLAAESGETVHLSIYENGQVVYVEKIESQHPVRAYTEIGGRAPAYCVATGKSLLAFQDPDEIDTVAGKLVAFTANTIVSPDALRATLSEVRAGDYAVNRGEWRAQVSGVGAPIRNASNQVIAAIGVSGPTERFNEAALALFIPMVRYGAQDISRAMGATRLRGNEL